MADMSLYYEKIMNDESSLYRATITGVRAQNGSRTVAGVLNSAVPLAGGNEFESAKTALSKLPLIGKVFELSGALSDFTRLAGKDTAMAVEQTRKIWQESRTPVLSVEMTFWGLQAGDLGNRPIDKVLALYSGVMPTKSAGGFLISAPLGYRFTDENFNASGLVALNIGTWLRATELVMTNVNFTPSLEVMADGSPLYMTGSVELEPFKMITFDEFLAWFPQLPLNRNANGGADTSDNFSPKAPFSSEDPDSPQGRLETITA